MVVEGDGATGLAARLRQQGSLDLLSDILEAAIAVPEEAAAEDPPANEDQHDEAPPASAYGQTPVEPPEATLLLARRLRRGGADPSVREQRVRRAYELGRLDGQLIAPAQEGARVRQAASPSFGGDSLVYFAVLHGVAHAPYWTGDRDIYHAEVRPSGRFVAGSVSRGLPTWTEFTAYLAGLGGPLPERR